MISIVFLFGLDMLLKIYLFSQLSKQKVKTSVQFVFAFLVGVIAVLLSETFLYIEPVMLFLLAFWLRPRWRLKQYLFYCLLPFSSVDLFQRMSGFYELKRVIFSYPADSFEAYLFIVIGLSLFLGMYLVFVKVFRIDFDIVRQLFYYPQFHWLVRVLNASMLFYSVLLHSILVWGGSDQEASITMGLGTTEFSIDLNLSQLFLFIGFIIYTNLKLKDILEEEIRESKEEQLAAMMAYSHHIESLYKEIRGFRHDYTNVLISFNEAIKHKDMATIEKIYRSVLADSDKLFYKSGYDIANLANLQHAAMKSIVSAKMIEAQSKGISLSVEVEKAIDVPEGIEVIELLKVLSIFLDNAIEGASQASTPELWFSYFKDGKTYVLLIENSSFEERINTKTIYDYGHSSKGADRGIGLATVKTIVDKYPQMSLMTSSQNYRFRQELTVGVNRF